MVDSTQRGQDAAGAPIPSSEPPPGEIHKASGVLSSYLTVTGRELRHERNRIYFYSLGLALLFLLIAIPIARWVLAPSGQWAVAVPSLVIIALTFLRERRETKTASPINAAAAHPPRLPSEAGFELEMYWGYRPTAHNDIHEAITSARNELFVAGIALNTIGDTLGDPEVIRAIAANCVNNAEYRITLVTLASADHTRAQETGGADLEDHLRRGHDKLREFYASLSARVPRHIPRPLVHLRTYPAGVVPRHFLLRSDHLIYAGSYLAHKQGSYSYLLKLRRSEVGALYELFSSEIDYLKQISEPLDVDNFMKASDPTP